VGVDGIGLVDARVAQDVALQLTAGAEPELVAVGLGATGDLAVERALHPALVLRTRTQPEGAVTVPTVFFWRTTASRTSFATVPAGG
jgi:hypothetical protein